jgi:hypothetical protein
VYIILFIVLILIISILDFVFTAFKAHALITVSQKKNPRSSAEDLDIHSDDDSAGASESAKLPSTRKRNSKGLVCLVDGVVSMLDLDLASRVPTKTRDDDAAKMFHAKLTLSKAFSLYTMMVYGPRMPIEKARDEPHRRILLYSAAPYCLSKETLETILGADRDELSAYEQGLA